MKRSFIRSAILLNDAQWLAWGEQWVELILAKASETGCITIYSPETRFPDKGYDGELWTQSRAFQAFPFADPGAEPILLAFAPAPIPAERGSGTGSTPDTERPASGRMCDWTSAIMSSDHNLCVPILSFDSSRPVILVMAGAGGEPIVFPGR